MRRHRLIQRIMRVALVTSAIALFSVVVFPHHHDASSFNQTDSCRACKIQDGFTATKPVAPVIPLRLVHVALVQIPTLEAPSLGVEDRLHTPRAPPQLS